MMGAYSIRRLIDSQKSSSLLPGKRVRTLRFPLLDREPMVLDRFSPADFYDLSGSKKTELNVTSLCNQIIHSFVFQIYLEEDSTTSVVFTSDRDRGKHLHGIAFDVLADLLDYVGREDIIDLSGHMVEGEQTFTNRSNHDAVESGRATYSDDDQMDIAWIEDEIPPFSQGVLEMVARRIENGPPHSPPDQP